MDRPAEVLEARQALERWWRAAVRAVDPVAATSRALAAMPRPERAPVVLAFGKAAAGMALAVEQWLGAHGLAPATGLVVCHEAPPANALRLPVVLGEHPVPGAGSRAAADRLAEVIATLPAGAPVLVLLSGGTSSLLAAPLAPIADAELGSAFETFHALGLDIHAMNALRRHLTRWSAGRLATALAGRDVRALVISDVVDNDLAAIGSGPLVGGALAPDTVARLLAQRDLLAQLPASVVAALGAPAPPATRVPHVVVADRAMAVQAAAQAAQAEGVRVHHHTAPLDGETDDAAIALADWLGHEVLARRIRPGTETGIWITPGPRLRELHVWSGETTVMLPDAHGTGGRAQQFALVAARRLDWLGRRRALEMDVPVLVAGTDGRDGPTDAAGAFVDGWSGSEWRAKGIDVEAAIGRRDAYPALDAIGALFRPGATGTNVGDLVLAMPWSWY